MAYVGGTAAGEASEVISLSQWTLDASTDRVDVTSFGDSNKQYVQGFPDIQFTLAGFWDNSESKLFTARDETSPVKVYLYPSRNALTKYWYGPAYVDYSLDVSVSDAAKVSATGAAGGNWGRM